MTESLVDVIRQGSSRGLDFVTLEELRKRTGVDPKGVLKWACAEMLCNSLDTDATEIHVDVETLGDFVTLTVSDNGSKKLSIEELKLILDFDNKASSKRGLLRVTRGYLGNALKSCFGYSYALIESKGLPTRSIIVESGSEVYTVTLQPDRIRENINSEIATAPRQDDGFKRFTVSFPSENINLAELRSIVFATSLVNPTRRITYEVNHEKTVFGWSEKTKAIRQETSVLWYSQKQFETLFRDYVRTTPDAQLKQFIVIFRGFTSKEVIREILQKLGVSNHDSEAASSVQFLPATTLSTLRPSDVAALYAIMRSMAKPIETRSTPSVLGCVGKETFEKIKTANGWQRLRYVILKSQQRECDITKSAFCNGFCDKCDDPTRVVFPYLVELAVFDRKSDDTEGLKVIQCVNFMASMEDVFSRIFDIRYRLGRVGIKQDSPVTVLAHLVCPVLKWLNYGKSGLDE